MSENVREILSLLTPFRVKDYRKIRVGGFTDGGYVMIDSFPAQSKAYSLGVGGDVSWDLDMASREIDVYQFDHTVNAPPSSHKRFKFSKMGIAAEPSPEGPFETLDNLISANNHTRSNLILKMDIEDAEWQVLTGTGSETLNLFSQIVVEFHGLARLFQTPWQDAMKSALAKLRRTHVPFHVHGNNWGSYAIVSGVPVPDVLEVSFANRSMYNFEVNQEHFPTPLDRPCKLDTEDFYLGTFSFGLLPALDR